MTDMREERVDTLDRQIGRMRSQLACAHFPTNAEWPVIARPTISELISRVPS